MFEGFFQPFHLLIILFIAVLSYGMPFVAGYFLGRYVEMQKLKGLTETMTTLVATKLNRD
ncbi:MAG TPA: hypothetical protein VMX38_05915 [Verrucomicrobiae bacterium]|jgi:hypothetical protein|nr:hypothetical protein [Verrucomicrobiae bacterium]